MVISPTLTLQVTHHDSSHSRTDPFTGVLSSAATHRPDLSVSTNAVQAFTTFAPSGVELTQVIRPPTQFLRGFQSPPSTSRCYPSDGRLDGD
jgi:hypothetical protein